MLSKKQWLLLTIGWFILTPGVFFLSERFMDIDIILYPSVLLLLVSMIFGPTLIGVLMPLPFTPKWNRARRFVVFLTYFVCYVFIWLFARFCFMMNWC